MPELSTPKLAPKQPAAQPSHRPQPARSQTIIEMPRNHPAGSSRPQTQPNEALPPAADSVRRWRADELTNLHLKVALLAGAVRTGWHRAGTGESGLEFHDYRPYRAGDDLRAIDWRAFGRHERLIVRRAAHLGEITLDVRLDASTSMAFAGLPTSPTVATTPEATSSKWQVAASLAGALAWLAIRQGDRCGIAISAGAAVPSAPHHAATGGNAPAAPARLGDWRRLPAGSGPAHLARILDRIEHTRPAGIATMAQLAAPNPLGHSGRPPATGAAPLDRHRLTIILTDGLEPAGLIIEAARGLARASGSRVALVRVLTAAEAEGAGLADRIGSPDGALEVCDPEHLADHPEDATTAHRGGAVAGSTRLEPHAYRRLMEHHQRLLWHGLAAARIPAIEVRTETPLLASLTRVLAALAVPSPGGR